MSLVLNNRAQTISVTANKLGIPYTVELQWLKHLWDQEN